ncbi:cAMP-dependent protein kinase type II regulatory subunit [Galendromus occidentalis]|uniref:cAMP-dependent protein kinase type II regulatory subunit n=1 Tax=Galendromus occidentalis TaxID=34638 RepID=A0AAJ6VWA2_9ACAR|nr:cAMP-dependent protein kinase type II regulatory subunit [Galendromus occidentalis]
MNRHDVPPELTNLLMEFTVSVLVERPEDILAYAAKYFTNLHEQRSASTNGGSQQNVENDEAIYSDEDEPEPPPPTRFNRRKSVFAEHYDPAEDEDDEAHRIIHPKSDEQREILAMAVKNILLFRSLDASQMQDVLDAMFERRVVPNEIVIQQGDDGDYFYVIQSGTYNIFVRNPTTGDNMNVGKYENHGSFGELALLYNQPRAATIQATTDGSLWAMNRQTFRRIVLKSAHKKRVVYEKLLESVPMLSSLNAYERMNLCDALMPKEFKEGDCIIKQGDSADGMYFLEDGTVSIRVRSEGSEEEKEISRFTNGTYFGELSLITHKPRAASVYACSDVKTAFLDVEAFERLLGNCVEIMKRNITHYEEQLVAILGSTNISDLR